MPTALPTNNIHRYFTESCNTITSHAIITDGISVGNAVGNYRLNFRRIYSVGNVPAGNFFFGAHVSVCKTVSVPSVGVFFICDRLSDGNGIYRRLVYQRTVSVGEASVFFSPTDFIAVTDGISSSIKLDNASIVVGSSFSTIYITLLLFIYSMWDMVSNIHYNYYKYCHKGTSNNEL